MSERIPDSWTVHFDEPHTADLAYYVEDTAGHQLMLIQRLAENGPESFKRHLRLIANAPDILERLIATAAGLRQLHHEWEHLCDFDACPVLSDIDRNEVAIANATEGAS